MPDPTISDKQKALRKAVAEYCEKNGVNAATISLVTEKIVGLLASRWEHICDVALGDENEGKVNVGLRINFDMSHKCPVGTVNLSFSQRTQEDCEFHVDDPNQPALPFGEAVRANSPSSNRANRTAPSTNGTRESASTSQPAQVSPESSLQPTPRPPARRRRAPAQASA